METPEYQRVSTMSKNMIQFQKGLSLHEIFKMYGSEHQCYEVLFRLRWPFASSVATQPTANSIPAIYISATVVIIRPH
jgi:hypothetical protein